MWGSELRTWCMWLIGIVNKPYIGLIVIGWINLKTSFNILIWFCSQEYQTRGWNTMCTVTDARRSKSRTTSVEITKMWCQHVSNQRQHVCVYIRYQNYCWRYSQVGNAIEWKAYVTKFPIFMNAKTVSFPEVSSAY